MNCETDFHVLPLDSTKTSLQNAQDNLRAALDFVDEICPSLPPIQKGPRTANKELNTVMDGMLIGPCSCFDTDEDVDTALNRIVQFGRECRENTKAAIRLQCTRDGRNPGDFNQADLEKFSVKATLDSSKLI